MGLGGISIWQLLIILVIILLIFGTKKLRNLGSDLGGALKGFKDAVNDQDKKVQDAEQREALSKEESTASAEAKDNADSKNG